VTQVKIRKPKIEASTMLGMIIASAAGGIIVVLIDLGLRCLIG
jgi:hypothetical protein